MSTRFSLRNKKGFTLIELLIVITIIGILAVALIPRVSQGPAKARDVKRKADINNIATALELYYSDEGSYPLGVDGSTKGYCADDATLFSALSNYIQAMPTDPGEASTASGCNNYYYFSIDGGNSYSLFANVEIDNVESDGYYCYSSFPSTTGFDTYTDASFVLSENVCSGTDGQDAYYVVLR